MTYEALEAQLAEIRMGAKHPRPRRKHQEDDIDEDQICELVQAGWRREDVARLHRLSYSKIKQILEKHGHASARAGVQRIDYPEDPIVFTARQVIAAACEDWASNKYTSVMKEVAANHRERGFTSLRDELKLFWHSQEFEWWCDLAELDADAVREAQEPKIEK